MNGGLHLQYGIGVTLIGVTVTRVFVLKLGSLDDGRGFRTMGAEVPRVPPYLVSLLITTT